MLQSIALILLSLAFIISVKRLKAKIKETEYQRFIALNTCHWLINSAENRKQLIGILGKYALTTEMGIEDPEFRKQLLEATPGIPWEGSIDNYLVCKAVLNRFNDEENPLKNGGYYHE